MSIDPQDRYIGGPRRLRIASPVEYSICGHPTPQESFTRQLFIRSLLTLYFIGKLKEATVG
jgi:hypothetical protein